MSGTRDVVLIVGIALLPLCSIQHFIWPLSWCLLADICNHTWIPECGYDELMDSYRLFIDECDMFEYNCDHETDYEAVNYSECFKQQMCPVANIPCPSRPTCPDHRYHRMGDRYIYITPARRNARRNMRRNGMRMNNLQQSLPPKMLKGKRRYTPKGRRKRTTKTIQRMLTKLWKVFVKRRTLASKQPAKPTRTRSRPPTRTTIGGPTRSMRQASVTTTKAPTVKISKEPVMSAKSYTRKKGKRRVKSVPSAAALLPSNKYEHKTIRSIATMITAAGPIRTILSTVAPISFRTIILKKHTVIRFGKKVIRIVKGRIT